MVYKGIIENILLACLFLLSETDITGISQPGTLFHKGVHMRVTKRDWGSLYETDVLILGTGASGMGAALKAAEKHADVLMLGKGTLESSGSLGGGNDHFMAVLDTDEAYDNVESFVDFT